MIEKRFRQDLFYRLHDFGITVPPLRDCQEDILPLAEFFREIANKELECNVSGFSSEARKALLTHVWPGNVRELRHGSCIASAGRCGDERTSGACCDQTDLTRQFRPAQ